MAEDEAVARVSLRPDGRRVLVLRREVQCPGPPGAVCTIGHHMAAVTWQGANRIDIDEFVAGAAWLGKNRLAVASALRPYTLAVIKGPRFAAKRIVVEEPYPGVSDPAASPDLLRIAVSLFRRDGSSYLALANVRTGRVRVLTRGPSDREPAWSPDGRSIAYVRRGRIAIIDIAARRIRFVGPAGGSPTWGGAPSF